MTRLLATLLLCLTACAPSGIYRVHSHSVGTAVAISTREVVTVAHPPYVGKVLYLETWAGQSRYVVVEILDASTGLLRCAISAHHPVSPGANRLWSWTSAVSS